MWFKQTRPSLTKGYSQKCICADYVWERETDRQTERDRQTQRERERERERAVPQIILTKGIFFFCFSASWTSKGIVQFSQLHVALWMIHALVVTCLSYWSRLFTFNTVLAVHHCFTTLRCALFWWPGFVMTEQKLWEMFEYSKYTTCDRYIYCLINLYACLHDRHAKLQPSTGIRRWLLRLTGVGIEMVEHS